MAKRSLSVRAAVDIIDRLRAALEFEQEITLSPDEIYVLLSGIERMTGHRFRR